MTFDFVQTSYEYLNGKFKLTTRFGKVVDKQEVDGGFIIAYQELGDIFNYQEIGMYDGELLDEMFNRALFCSYEDIEEARRIRFFESKTTNASIFLKENPKYRYLCRFDPKDFDDVRKTSSATCKEERRVIVFENVNEVLSIENPCFYLCGTETKTKQGVKRVWELWRDNERVECDKIILADMFYHKSFGDDHAICTCF